MFTYRTTLKYDVDCCNITINSKKSLIFINDWQTNCIHICKLDGTYINKINSDEFNELQVKPRTHIYMDNTNDQLFIANQDKHKVIVFNLQGQYIKNIPTSRYLFNVCCNHEMMFAVGSTGNVGWFEIYDKQNGNKINECKDVQFGPLLSIIAWNNITREIFIPDYLNYRIIVLNEYGKLKRMLFNPNLNIYLIQHLSIDEFSNLMFVGTADKNYTYIIRCSDGTIVSIIPNHLCSFASYYDSNEQYLYISNIEEINVYSKII